VGKNPLTRFKSNFPLSKYEHANETAQVAKRDGDDYSIKKADYYAILAKDVSVLLNSI
jgi:hypothetical protein